MKDPHETVSITSHTYALSHGSASEATLPL